MGSQGVEEERGAWSISSEGVGVKGVQGHGHVARRWHKMDPLTLQ